MSKFKRNTHFLHGFNFQGKRESNVGEDLLSVKTTDTDEFPDGTPLKFDGAIDDVAIADADSRPDLILYSRVTDELSDFEWIMTDILRDEVKPGDPATAVLFKEGAILKTRLVDLDDLAVGDEVAAAGSVSTDKFSQDTEEVTHEEENVSSGDTIELDNGDVVESSVVITNDDDDNAVISSDYYTVDYSKGEIDISEDLDSETDFTDTDDLTIIYEYYKPFGAYVKTDTSADACGKVLEIEDDFVTIMLITN